MIPSEPIRVMTDEEIREYRNERVKMWLRGQMDSEMMALFMGQEQ